MKNPSDDWLTVDQASKELQIGVHRINQQIRERLVPTAMLGTYRVIPRSWVDAAVANRSELHSRTRMDWDAALAAFIEASDQGAA